MVGSGWGHGVVSSVRMGWYAEQCFGGVVWWAVHRRVVVSEEAMYRLI